MPRRALSERELRGIRNAMSRLPPDDAPRLNPLVAYPFRGSHSIDPGDAASNTAADQVFGRQPRNTVTAREIIAEIDRQLAERRQQR